MRKSYFYLGVVLAIAFEIANVYFIMPLPGSQQMRSIDVAYFLYHWRWVFRALVGALILAGVVPALRVIGWKRLLAPLALAVLAPVAYVTNVVMTADHIFLAPKTLIMAPADRNAVEPNRLVVGIEYGGEARAYPIQFIGYHHQVRDTVAGKPILVTFCTVCRTGRILDPVVDGKVETFRLVGMDHFNAMFEDQTTRSWWRQVNGTAIAGPRKGAVLPELESQQVTLSQWLALHPRSLIMQPDPAMTARYTNSYDYESGASRSSLTGTDTTSWKDKSWVIGVATNGASTAYDWNQLKRDRVINDEVGGRPIAIVLAGDGASFVAFIRPDAAMRIDVRGGQVVAGANVYDLAGRGARGSLQRINASQEFWHSWRTFHPETRQYRVPSQ
jgi:hypothetical protein